MTALQFSRLEELSAALHALREELVVDGKSGAYTKLEEAPAGEWVLSGNAEGLLRIATYILGLATAEGFPHFHLSLEKLTDGNRELIIRNDLAPWEVKM